MIARLFYILITILLGTIAYYTVKRFMKRKDNTDFIENKEFVSTTIKDVDVYLFHVEWCPYSRESLKVWEELKRDYSDHDLNMNFITVNGDEDKSAVTEYKVENFPTLILVADGKKFHFDANLTKATFEKFIQHVSSSLMK